MTEHGDGKITMNIDDFLLSMRADKNKLVHITEHTMREFLIKSRKLEAELAKAKDDKKAMEDLKDFYMNKAVGLEAEKVLLQNDLAYARANNGIYLDLKA